MNNEAPLDETLNSPRRQPWRKAREPSFRRTGLFIKTEGTYYGLLSDFYVRLALASPKWLPMVWLPVSVSTLVTCAAHFNQIGNLPKRIRHQV